MNRNKPIPLIDLYPQIAERVVEIKKEKDLNSMDFALIVIDKNDINRLQMVIDRYEKQLVYRRTTRNRSRMDETDIEKLRGKNRDPPIKFKVLNF